MEFQVQSVYLIYTWLMVHTTLNLAYPKEHVYYMPLTCDMILLQTQDLRVDQEKESCIRVNTRELNRKLCTR